MSKIEFAGWDPGKSGAGVLLDESGTLRGEIIRGDATFHDQVALITKDWDTSMISMLMIEKVHSMPRDANRGAFTFGTHYGFIQGVVCSLDIPHEFVTPQIWQREMGCMSKGDKNITKAAAQRLFPGIKITHRNADALLIAEYCRRKHLGISSGLKRTVKVSRKGTK